MTDTLFTNATILTQDPRLPTAEALAVTGGRVEAVGAKADVEPLANGATTRVDLGGACLVPGFNDAHVHVWKVGQLLTAILDLRPIDSLERLARALQERDRELDEGIMRSLWLSREALEARADRLRSPMVLRSIDDYLKGNRLPLEPADPGALARHAAII